MKNKTPLMCTIENNAKDVIELLISSGANINITDIIYPILIIFFLIIMF